MTPAGPVEATRHALALEHLEDLRRIDEQMRASKRRIADAVKASGTTTTEVFGIGPVGAAIAIGQTRDVSRFANRDHFAAYNGTAPIEVGSGGHSVHRLSRRGNRQLNHAIHMAAITQIRHAHSPGRAYYDRKLAEGKTKKEALRALKRRISDALYERLVADAATKTGPGGQTGTTEQASVTGLTPRQPALRKSHSRTHTERRTRPRHRDHDPVSATHQNDTNTDLTTKRYSIGDRKITPDRATGVSRAPRVWSREQGPSAARAPIGRRLKRGVERLEFAAGPSRRSTPIAHRSAALRSHSGA